MAEIDLFKHQKKLQKEKLIKMLSEDKKTKTYLIATGLETTGAIVSNNDYMQAFFLILAITDLKNTLRYISSETKKVTPEEVEEITALIRHSSTYKECIREYNTFIKETAKFIRSIGFASAKDIVAYLQVLLDNGYFSEHMNHSYQKYQYEKEYVTELCGAKVSTGKCVCRHMSGLFADILSTLGYTAANIQVFTTTKNPTSIATNKKRISDHALVGVVENGERFMYDPTSGLFTTRATSIQTNIPELPLISEYAIPNKRIYVILDPISKVLNPQREKQMILFNLAKIATITCEEAEFIKNKAGIIFRGNEQQQYNFFNEQKERISKISKLYSELSPHSDKPIKKWLIRK